MAIFIPRLQAPEKTDKHWLRPSAGGVNECVHIKNSSVLPNCVGYAWGRWYELLGKEPKLSNANAEVWWRREDGYERGQVPKLGAVICWSKGVVGVGKDGAGHVAIVEQIKADGTIVTSNSAWNERGGTWWYKKTLKPPYTMKGYDFQGFIYLPMEFDDPSQREEAETFEELPEVEATGRSTGYLASLVGEYTVTAANGLNVRHGAGTLKKKMVGIPYGTKVKCYGYYGTSLGVRWLKVRFIHAGTQYTGFAHSKWLKKQ